MKMPGNRQIIQVVPRMKPARCGVSDHAIVLAWELEGGFGIHTAIAVLNSNETTKSHFPSCTAPPPNCLRRASL